jgi:hypothetical protein
LVDNVDIGAAPNRLVLRLVESEGQERYLRAELLLDSLNASLFVHDLPGAGKRGDFDALADAFVEFGSDFGARNAEEIWTSADHDLVMFLGADALGHVFLTVELSQAVEDGWSVRASDLVSAHCWMVSPTCDVAHSARRTNVRYSPG